MKKFILSFLLFSFSLVSYAQREIVPVNWEEIKKVVAESPDSVKTLVTRTIQKDTTLSIHEFILAFYGQSIISKGKESELVFDCLGLFSRGDYKEALLKAREALAINPLSIKALEVAGMSILILIKSGDPSYSADEANDYYVRESALLYTISRTGDGSKEHPFYVTSLPDEYVFMTSGLGVKKIIGQACQASCDSRYDIFTLGEKSKNYSKKEVWFDVSRHFEYLLERFVESEKKK